jgi:hypothetical protein
MLLNDKKVTWCPNGVPPAPIAGQYSQEQSDKISNGWANVNYNSTRKASEDRVQKITDALQQHNIRDPNAQMTAQDAADAELLKLITNNRFKYDLTPQTKIQKAQTCTQVQARLVAPPKSTYALPLAIAWKETCGNGDMYMRTGDFNMSSLPFTVYGF